MKFRYLKIKGGITMVDEDMFEFLSQYRWWIDAQGYARRSVSKGYKMGDRCLFLHHMVIGYPPLGLFTDHINGMALDNRRENLRFATRSQNAKNFPGWRKKKTSRFKGVFPRPGFKKWRAIITCDRKRFHIGDFPSELLAAKAYNDRAQLLFGEFARLNNLEKAGEPIRTGGNEDGNTESSQAGSCAGQQTEVHVER